MAQSWKTTGNHFWRPWKKISFGKKINFCVFTGVWWIKSGIQTFLWFSSEMHPFLQLFMFQWTQKNPTKKWGHCPLNHRAVWGKTSSYPNVCHIHNQPWTWWAFELCWRWIFRNLRIGRGKRTTSKQSTPPWSLTPQKLPSQNKKKRLSRIMFKGPC